MKCTFVSVFVYDVKEVAYSETPFLHLGRFLWVFNVREITHSETCCPFFSVSVEREPGEQSQQDCFSFEIIVKRTVTAVSIKHPVVLKVSMSFSSSLFPIYYCHC